MAETPFSYNPDNEQKILAYCFQHPQSALALKSEHFLHPVSQAIVKGVQELTQQNLEFDLDTVVALALKHNDSITYKLLRDIQEAHTDFTNIDFCKQVLVSDWAKHKGTGQMFEKISETMMKTGQLDTNMMRDYGRELFTLADKVEATNVKALLTFADLVDNHRQELEERSTGTLLRSIGYRALDRRLTAPGAVGQYALVFGLTGSGKSLWTKNAELNLLQSNIPVVSFNIEMGNSGGRMGTAIMDLMVCILGEFTIDQLYRKNMDPRLKARIQQTYKRIAALQHYMFYGLEEIDLDGFSNKIAEAREIFRAKGILPPDGYMMTVADLLSDFEDFADESKEKILLGVKHFDKIIKRQKVSALAVVQANENKIRGGRIFSEPDDLDKYRLGLEDIYGGSGYAKKARVVISLHRPTFMKLRFFPDHPMAEEWEKSPDIINVHVVKQNMGKLSFTPMIFDPKGLRITPVKAEHDDHKSEGGSYGH